MGRRSRSTTALLLIAALAIAGASAAGPTFLSNFKNNTHTKVQDTFLGNNNTSGQNPYGVWVMPNDVGPLKQGDVLVSNENNATNAAATGMTITRVTADGMATEDLYVITPPAECGGGLGLVVGICTTASGWIVVGSVFAPNAQANLASATTSCVMLLDPTQTGQAVKPALAIHGSMLSGVWSTACAEAPLPNGNELLFVGTGWPQGAAPQDDTPALTGSVVKVTINAAAKPCSAAAKPSLVGMEYLVQNKFLSNPSPAFQVGPTGLLLVNNNLFIADTLGNAIWACGGAGAGGNSCHKIAAANATEAGVKAAPQLNLPLGICVVKGNNQYNGHMIVVNGGDSNAVELNPGSGQQLDFLTIDTNPGGDPAGTLFGCAWQPGKGGNDFGNLYFVNDADNSLNTLTRA